MAIDVSPVPALDSNYIWVITHTDKREAYLVDPGAAEPALAYLNSRELSLKGILVTHSHGDHTAGIGEIVQSVAKGLVGKTESREILPVIGPDTPKISSVNQIVSHQSIFHLWPDCEVEVLAVPGHLPEHLAYFIRDIQNQSPVLFSGDCLFSSGCGRMFNGTPKEFYLSLMALAKLPDDTRVYCGHEYTQSNLAFAAFIEPDNAAIQSKIRDCEARLRSLGCTLPSTIASEKLTNPFLRCRENKVHSRAFELTGSVADTEVDVFAQLRKLKDSY